MFFMRAVLIPVHFVRSNPRTPDQDTRKIPIGGKTDPRHQFLRINNCGNNIHLHYLRYK